MAFHLECAQSLERDDATERDIREAMADDAARGEYIILTSEDGSFLQAAGEEDGPYALIYHDEPANRHYQAHEELSRTEVERALTDYLHGRTRWWNDYSWNEVKHDYARPFLLGVVCLILAAVCAVLAYLFW